MILINTINIKRNLKYFYCVRYFINTNILCIASKRGLVFIRVPVTNLESTVKLSWKNFYINAGESFFYQFAWFLSQRLIGMTCLWFMKFFLLGLGFKLFFNRQSRTCKMDIGYCHLVFILIPNDIKMHARRWRGQKTFYVMGSDKYRVSKLIKLLLAIRPSTKYKFKGMRSNLDPLKLKLGKVKKYT